MAVALLARRPEPLTELATSLRSSNPGAVLETFPTDTSPEQLRKTFGEIRNHKSFQGLKLDLAVFSIKNSAKKPFMEETVEGFMETLEDCKFVTCVTSLVGVVYESLTKNVRQMLEVLWCFPKKPSSSCLNTMGKRRWRKEARRRER